MFENARSLPYRPLRTIIYGVTRTGKTTSATTWPGPVAFLSVGIEGGDATLRYIASQPGAPDVRVQVVYRSSDMLQAIDFIAANPNFCRTLVVDPVSLYADLYISELVEKNRGPMRKQDWGLLDTHLLKSIVPRLHLLPQHIVWIALEKLEQGGDDSPARGEPLLPGAMAKKLPAMCDLIIHMDMVTSAGPDKRAQSTPAFRMTPHGPFMAGGRFGNAFLDNNGIFAPDFRGIAERIGQYIGLDGHGAHGPAAARAVAAPPRRMAGTPAARG